MKRFMGGMLFISILLSGISIGSVNVGSATMKIAPPVIDTNYQAMAEIAAANLAGHMRFETDGRVWVERTEGSPLASASWGASLAGMAHDRFNQLAPGAENGLDSEQIAVLVGAYWDADEESLGYAASLGDKDHPWTSRYIDDGMWAAELRMLQYEHQGRSGDVPDETAPAEAQAMLDIATRNYDPKTGLVFWKDQRQEAKKELETRNHSLSTVAAVTAIELALMINRISPGERYRDNLDFAMEAYDGLRRSMRDEDNLYREGIHANGEVNRSKYPYVQGVMIHVGGLLHEATRQPLYLAEAERTAVAALRFYNPEHLGRSDQMFVAVYFDRLYEFRNMTIDEGLRASIHETILAHTKHHAALLESPVEIAPYGFRSSQLHMASLAALLLQI